MKVIVNGGQIEVPVNDLEFLSVARRVTIFCK